MKMDSPRPSDWSPDEFSFVSLMQRPLQRRNIHQNHVLQRRVAALATQSVPLGETRE